MNPPPTPLEEEEEEPWPDLLDEEEDAEEQKLVIHDDDAPDGPPAKAPRIEDPPSAESGSAGVSAEDAAREAMASVESALSPEYEMALFLALVRVLNRELKPSRIDLPGLGPELVRGCVAKAKELFGFREQTAEEASAAAGHAALQEAIARATACSHYQGTDRHRLNTAILQTLKGELPLTQAAATHAVPFSTLHPYVKRAKAQLGLIPASEANALKSPLNVPHALINR